MESPIQYAGIWRRFFAPVIDEALQFLIIGILLWLPTLLTNSQLELRENLYLWWFAVVTLVTFLTDIWFRLYWVVHFGGTPGDKILGLKVESDLDAESEAKPISYSQSFLRASVYISVNIVAVICNLWTLSHDNLFSSGAESGKVIDRVFAAFGNLLSAEIPYVTKFVTIFSMIWMAIEMICVLADEKKRMLSDRLGKTVVRMRH